MKNTLGDLNNHLFAQIERLGEEDLKDDALREEIGRAKAIANIATQIIANGNLALKVKAVIYEYANGDEAAKKFPPMLKASFLDG